MLYYQKNGADLPLDWEDYAIQEELFGAEDTLTFTLPPEHPQLHDMTPRLELTDKDSGQRYLITAMDEGDVTARLDTDSLKATIWQVYSNHSDTPAGTASGVLPAGWLCIDHTARADKKTLALEGVTPLDVLRETADKFGVGVRIGTASRKVELFDRTADTASRAYFTEELNLLQRPVRSAKAEDFATRLYAYGKDGMTFADINDGKEYVEDHSWSDRVICAYWKDERYTVKENLLADAKAKLAAMAVPAVSYECSVADLARIDPQRWGQLSVQLYSAVILMDRVRGTRTVHHVARIKRWPHHPEKNVVTLSTVPGTLRGKVEQTWNAVSDHNSDFRQIQQAAVDSATAQITGNKGGYVVLHSSTGAKEPDEVLIMDKPDIATATRVWRWNKSGLGYSGTGYNGPYGLAMTQDGAIVADFITAGTLNAALIRAGVLQDKTGKVFKLDLGAGTLDADFTSLKIAGKSTEEISKSEIEQSAKMLSLSVKNQGTSSSLTLMYDGAVLSSQNIEITGFVTFSSLSTSGQSTINGGNITTGTIGSAAGNTQYNLDEGWIRTGTASGAHVLINSTTIRWFIDANTPTGMFHSLSGRTYIGANSRYTMFGWLPNYAPSFYPSTGGPTSEFVGLYVDNVEGLIHCCANKFEIPGRIECASLRVNGREI